MTQNWTLIHVHQCSTLEWFQIRPSNQTLEDCFHITSHPIRSSSFHHVPSMSMALLWYHWCSTGTRCPIHLLEAPRVLTGLLEANGSLGTYEVTGPFPSQTVRLSVIYIYIHVTTSNNHRGTRLVLVRQTYSPILYRSQTRHLRKLWCLCGSFSTRICPGGSRENQFQGPRANGTLCKCLSKAVDPRIMTPLIAIELSSKASIITYADHLRSPHPPYLDISLPTCR